MDGVGGGVAWRFIGATTVLLRTAFYYTAVGHLQAADWNHIPSFIHLHSTQIHPYCRWNHFLHILK
jgi:hypothetical protein